MTIPLINSSTLRQFITNLSVIRNNTNSIISIKESSCEIKYQNIWRSCALKLSATALISVPSRVSWSEKNSSPKWATNACNIIQVMSSCSVCSLRMRDKGLISRSEWESISCVIMIKHHIVQICPSVWSSFILNNIESSNRVFRIRERLSCSSDHHHLQSRGLTNPGSLSWCVPSRLWNSRDSVHIPAVKRVSVVKSLVSLFNHNADLIFSHNNIFQINTGWGWINDNSPLTEPGSDPRLMSTASDTVIHEGGDRRCGCVVLEPC